MDYYSCNGILDRLRKRFLNHPESGTSIEWSQWENHAKKSHPTLYFILETVPAKFWRWFFVNFNERFNEYVSKYWYKPHRVTIDIKRFPVNTWGNNKRHYFKYASDSSFLYINFQMLVDRIESMDKNQVYRQQERTDISKKWGELEVLYLWWTETRPKRDKSQPKFEDYGLVGNTWGIDENGVDNQQQPGYAKYSIAADKMSTREKRYEKIDEEMLEKLIANCKYLRY